MTLPGAGPPPCTCRCPNHPDGCPADAHTHYRPGTDCGCCGRDRCPTYQAQEKEGATR